jgi:hypothetical protein
MWYPTLIVMISCASVIQHHVRTVPPASQMMSLDRCPMPVEGFPLKLGTEAARHLVDDVLGGTQTITVREDELVYLGGGVTAYPRDLRYMTITINWSKIRDELAAR